MGAVWFVARADLRRRWLGAAALVLLVGVAGGAVLAASAGARRTHSSLARFEEGTAGATFEIDVGDATPQQIQALRKVPVVEGVGQLRQVALYSEAAGFLPTAGPVGRSFGRDIDRSRLVEGRWAHGVDELNIGEGLAARLDLQVGDRLPFGSFTQEQIDSGDLENGTFDPHGPAVDFRVVGIVRRPLDLGVRGEAGGVVVPTRAFMRAYADRIGSFSGTILRVRTRNGDADAARISAAAHAIFGGSDSFSVQSLGIEGRGARNAIGVTTAGLWVLAAVTAVAGLVAIALAMARRMAGGADEQDALRSLGLRRRQRWAAVAVQSVPIAVGGGLLAAAVAALASPAFPLGVARQAEPEPGFRLDPTVLGLGFVLVATVVLVVGAVAAVVATAGRTAADARPSMPSRVVAGASLPPTVATGVGFALERGRGRRAVPVWSTIGAASLGVLGVVAALSFGSSLQHLVSEPRAYGWNWDYAAFGLDHPDDPGPSRSSLVGNRAVADVATVCYTAVEIAGRPANAWAFQPVAGTIDVPVVAGRAPRGPGEIALGSDLLDGAHRAVGDSVLVVAEGGHARYRIVGRVVMPGIGDPQPLAGSAVMTVAGLERVGGASDSYTLVSATAGSDRAQLVRRLRGANDTDPLVATVPAEIERLRQIDRLPLAIALLTALVAVIALAYTLVVSVRRRGRDLAVLKTLGFTRGQVRAAVAWQATVLMSIGLVIGGALGIVVGRAAWHTVADDLGVATGVTAPVVGYLLLVPVALVLANLVAAIPARTAARTPPAVVLRSE